MEIESSYLLIPLPMMPSEKVAIGLSDLSQFRYRRRAG